jgi:predicted cobalt transporter CbtA
MDRNDGEGAMRSLGAVLKAAVLAGLIAGAVTSGLHALILEPVIEQAIELEEQQMHQTPGQGHSHAEPLIDRTTQRWGLLLGFLLYGAIWGMLFGLVVYVTQGWLPPTWTVLRRGLLLALLVGWSVAMFPFLKYPGNPPGVGEAESIGYRQTLYFGFIGLSIAGVALVAGGYQLLHRIAASSSLRQRGWQMALGFYVIYAVALYVSMPANPDPVEMPAQLVMTFRLLSFVGLLVFWGVLGGAFGWLATESKAEVYSHSLGGRGRG